MGDPENSGILFSLTVGGDGSAEEPSWPEFMKAWDGPGLTWIHLNYRDKAAQKWLYEESSLPEPLVEYLVSLNSRPGLYIHDDILVLILRGLAHGNDDPGEELASVRFALDLNRFVSLRFHKVEAFQGEKDKLLAGTGAKNASEFLMNVLEVIMRQVTEFVEDMVDGIERLEAAVLKGDVNIDRDLLNRLRLESASTRRFLAPQSAVFEDLSSVGLSWLTEKARLKLRNYTERTLRLVEDIDLVRERARIVQDEINHSSSEDLNRKMYVLAVAAAVFLPATLISGVFGMNLGGLPGSEHPQAFWFAVGGLTVTMAVILVCLRKMKWY